MLRTYRAYIWSLCMVLMPSAFQPAVLTIILPFIHDRSNSFMVSWKLNRFHLPFLVLNWQVVKVWWLSAGPWQQGVLQHPLDFFFYIKRKTVKRSVLKIQQFRSEDLSCPPPPSFCPLTSSTPVCCLKSEDFVCVFCFCFCFACQHL